MRYHEPQAVENPSQNKYLCCHEMHNYVDLKLVV